MRTTALIHPMKMNKVRIRHQTAERIPIVRLPKIRTAKIWMRMMRRTTTNGIHGWQKQ